MSRVTRGIRQPSPVPNGYSGTGTVPGGYPCLTGTYHWYSGVPIPVLHLIFIYGTHQRKAYSVHNPSPRVHSLCIPSYPLPSLIRIQLPLPLGDIPPLPAPSAIVSS